MFRFVLPSCFVLVSLMSVASWPTPAQTQERSRIRPFIVGGETANIADFPYQVGLRVTRDGEHYRCGGSLIFPNLVLTVAHCFVDHQTGKRYTDPAGVQIRWGSNKWEPPASSTGASEVIIHENYNTQTIENDIALIITSAPIDGEPLLLEWALGDNLSGTAVVTGWGRTSETTPVSDSDVLMKATVPLVPTDTCNQPTAYNGSILDGMLCAGKEGVDHCKGDSGGPLVQSRSTQHGPANVQIGIVSWAKDGNCARLNEYGVYTRVNTYLRWIEHALFQRGWPANGFFHGYAIILRRY